MTDLRSFFREIESLEFSLGDQDLAKRAAAECALSLVRPGMVLGLGTGSTVDFFLQLLAEEVRRGLSVTGIPTSDRTQQRALELGIPLVNTEGVFCDLRNDLCVDGADRVDANGQLIKGGGGALLREKLVATHSAKVCILTDPSKLRMVLDSSFALPVECLHFGIDSITAELASLGCEASLRCDAAKKPLLTDNGNLIVDCLFSKIEEPRSLELEMSSISGVMEVGLFCGMLDHLVVGVSDDTVKSWGSTGK